jgi:hypothetical protein
MILGILFNNEIKVMNDKRNYEWYDNINTLPVISATTLS